jgi:hypothetical protein
MKVAEDMTTLNDQQREEVRGILRRYAVFFTSKPGLCRDFEYEFELMSDTPITSRERPIPYALRPAVRAQIEEMQKDRILELSKSPYLNPLTIVPRKNKAPRICIDARRLNAITIADPERAQPMNEMLQRFDGVQYSSSLDLTAAFRHIRLSENVESIRLSFLRLNSTNSSASHTD